MRSNKTARKLCAIVVGASLIGSTGIINAETNSQVSQQVVNQSNLEVVDIPDTILRKVIIREIGKNDGDIITKLDMESIYKLDIDGNSIGNLEGIQYANNLEVLDIKYWRTGDISKISSLKKLKELDIFSSQIRNIDFLSGLENLKSLSLDCEISDISPISSLKNLEKLSISSNQIEDIHSLAELKNLKQLDIGLNNISDMSSISALKNLDELMISYSQIEDINFLSGLESLKSLGLYDNNKINNISPISSLKNLEKLIISSNQVEDIHSLVGLENLKILSLPNNQISDISTLSKLKNLEELFLDNNHISNIKPLSELINLKQLSIMENNIMDFSPLKELSKKSDFKLSKIDQKVYLEEQSFKGGNLKIKNPFIDCNGNIMNNLYLYTTDKYSYMNMNNYGKPDGEYIVWENITEQDIKYNNFYLPVAYDEECWLIGAAMPRTGYNEYHFSVGLVPIKPFFDLDGHWAESNIRDFQKKGYVAKDINFRPNDNITRAEFVKILNKSFGITKSSGKTFNDTKNHWAKVEIDIAVTNNVCNGKSSIEFKPNDPITREEAAVMVANYKKLADKNYDKLSKYKDASKVSSWAKSSVEGMLEKKYIGGYSDNTIKPKNSISRAEAVTMLSRIK